MVAPAAEEKKDMEVEEVLQKTDFAREPPPPEFILDYPPISALQL